MSVERASTPSARSIRGHTGPTLRHVVTALLTAGLFILAIVGGASRTAISQLVESGRRVAHTNDVLYRVQSVLSRSTELQRAARGYLITGDDSFLAELETARVSLPSEIANLDRLTADNPHQQRRLADLGRSIEQQLAAVEGLVALRRSEGLQAALDSERSGEGERLMQAIRQVVDAMVAEENGLLLLWEEESGAHASTALLIITSGFALAIALALGSGVLLGREVQRRERVQREAEERRRELARAYVELDRTRLELVTAKEQILSRVSRELRAPLDEIYQLVTALQDGSAGELNDEQEEHLAVVARNAIQLQRTLGDVLEAARGGSGSLTLQPEALDAGEAAFDLVRVTLS
jgi:CHASE3 domain sensor protein